MKYFTSKTKVNNIVLVALGATAMISSLPHKTLAYETKNQDNGAFLRRTSTPKAGEQQLEQEVRHRSLAGGCSTNKKVTMVKFCIQGHCDAGSEGEHRLKLDGDWLYGGFRDYKQDTCHDVSFTKIVQGWKTLTVGTEEHDSTSQNDSYFATMAQKEWYNPTCEKYKIALSKPHNYAGAYKICAASSTAVGLFDDFEHCLSVKDYPEESFTWELEIEPDDSAPPTVYQSCKPEKKVSMYKFCIQGDCDAGAEGEHRLKLDGSWLYAGHRDYREGQCHNLNPDSLSVKSKTIQPGVPLRVATEEHDDWPNANDYWSADIASDEWYDPTCASYEIMISKEHTGQKKISRCIWYNFSDSIIGSKSIGACDKWVVPPQSFMWMMKVEPIPLATASCMSGETGVTLVDSESVNKEQTKTNLRVSPHNPDNQIVKVKDLKTGDLIHGLDSSKAPATCTVEAVGSFGTGEVYGNYTQGHYILDSNSGDVVAHGTEQTMSIQEKYDVLTSCPLGVDETGTAFTALDTDFCGGFSQEMSWSDYLHLHKAILRMVRGTGGYWFSGSTYRDFGFLKTHAPVVCETMLRCVKDHDDCLEFEDASIHFIENALSDEIKEKAYNSFTNIGRHRELGSVAAMVSNGGSVRK